VLEGKCFSGAEDMKSSVKKMLTGISVKDFKNCFEKRLKQWGQSE
jgi:hypothetical protein